MQQQVIYKNRNHDANKGRGLVGKQKIYDAEKVANWRKLKVEKRLSYAQLGELVGVSGRTIERAFVEY